MPAERSSEGRIGTVARSVVNSAELDHRLSGADEIRPRVVPKQGSLKAASANISLNFHESCDRKLCARLASIVHALDRCLQTAGERSRKIDCNTGADAEQGIQVV